MPQMIELENISLRYGKTPVLDVRRWQLPHGAQALLLGPSGSGKTSLLQLLAGLLRPTGGSVRVSNCDLGALSEAALDRFRGQHIGLVFQSFHLMAALTALDNLLLAQYLAGVPQDRNHCLQLLADLGVADYAQHYPRQLSHGQAQRVAIARALVNNPELVLADEPTSALDDAHCKLVIELLLEQTKQHGASLVVATHDARIKPYFTQTLELSL